ncbi:MAG TPA: TRAP transporter fused permease subunit [Tissierellaceae bacterium]|nr:TRAP transporter fused permease subunit [Tissierellaceae bacterium]
MTRLNNRDKLLYSIMAIFLLFQLYIALIKPLDPMLQSPIHLLLALLVVFLMKPLKKDNMAAKIFEFICYMAIIFLFYYTFSQTDRLVNRVQYVDQVFTIDYIATAVTIFILLEAVRRTLGSVLYGLIIFFIIYDWFGMYFPGILAFKGTNWRSFTEVMTMGSSGVYGAPLYTSVTSLFYFILFGALFSTCGGGQLLIDIGMKTSSKGSGGPAKAAVISSGLMGMISGSAVANVSTTGVLTIPMMKEVGYEPHEAGAIEAVASTGGQIMPPIMGIGAFIMAEMLGVPYKDVAAAAIIPALAYFISILLLVTFLAKRRDAGDIEEISTEIKIEPILPRLYLLLPAIILVYYIIQGKSLMRSGMMGIFAIIAVNFAGLLIQDGKNYIPIKSIWESIKDGIQQAANIAIPTAACGIIIGIVIQSGLASRFADLIASLGTENLLVALLIAMLGCMILGMALPTVAAYLVSNILFVPVLIRLGIGQLPANMFVFYFGIMAQITPPVCLASYTAAGIAGADSMKTGVTGFVYALVAFLVPFIFIYQPAILLIGSVKEIIMASFVLLLGTVYLAAAMAGYLIIPLNKVKRGILLAGALLLIMPEPITDIIGLVMGTSILVLNLIISRKQKLGDSVEG